MVHQRLLDGVPIARHPGQAPSLEERVALLREREQLVVVDEEVSSNEPRGLQLAQPLEESRDVDFAARRVEKEPGPLLVRDRPGREPMQLSHAEDAPCLQRPQDPQVPRRQWNFLRFAVRVLSVHLFLCLQFSRSLCSVLSVFSLLFFRSVLFCFFVSVVVAVFFFSYFHSPQFLLSLPAILPTTQSQPLWLGVSGREAKSAQPIERQALSPAKTVRFRHTTSRHPCLLRQTPEQTPGSIILRR